MYIYCCIIYTQTDRRGMEACRRASTRPCSCNVWPSCRCVLLPLLLPLLLSLLLPLLLPLLLHTRHVQGMRKCQKRPCSCNIWPSCRCVCSALSISLSLSLSRTHAHTHTLAHSLTHTYSYTLAHLHTSTPTACPHSDISYITLNTRAQGAHRQGANEALARAGAQAGSLPTSQRLQDRQRTRASFAIGPGPCCRTAFRRPGT